LRNFLRGQLVAAHQFEIAFLAQLIRIQLEERGSREAKLTQGRDARLKEGSHAAAEGPIEKPLAASTQC
jgi:hypothetical protein